MPNLISDNDNMKIEIEKDDPDQLHSEMDTSGKTIEELKEQIRLEELEAKKNTEDSKSVKSDASTKSQTNTHVTQPKSESDLRDEANKIEEMHPSTKPKKDKMKEEMDKYKPKPEDDDDDGISDGMCYH